MAFIDDHVGGHGGGPFLFRRRTLPTVARSNTTFTPGLWFQPRPALPAHYARYSRALQPRPHASRVLCASLERERGRRATKLEEVATAGRGGRSPRRSAAGRRRWWLSVSARQTGRDGIRALTNHGTPNAPCCSTARCVLCARPCLARASCCARQSRRPAAAPRRAPLRPAPAPPPPRPSPRPLPACSAVVRAPPRRRRQRLAAGAERAGEEGREVRGGGDGGGLAHPTRRRRARRRRRAGRGARAASRARTCSARCAWRVRASARRRGEPC